METRIGTSGYSFDDWQGEFYPADLPKGKRLDYYCQHFSTVEINTTYYRIPHPAVMANMVRKVPDSFDFMVKVPQSFTHRRDHMGEDIDLFADCISPMIEANKLSGLLAQFPFSFKFNNANLDHVVRCRDAVGKTPLYCEFRHDSWVNRIMYDRLRAENIGYVCVDEPELPGLLKPYLFATTDTAYIRLHGRNSDKWWDGGALRYDYDYSPDELSQWTEKIRKIKSKIKRLYVYFNNCHQGQAAANASKFSQLLSK